MDNLREAREADPALNLEMLEDRASLLFWKWIDAQSRGSTKALHKVASAEAIGRLDEELDGLRQRRQRKVFLECAVGGVITRGLELNPDGFDRAHVEVRWSARMGIGPANERPPSLPTVPQRWVFTLLRKHGAQTNTDNGMSTNRCPQCNAPLTESAATTCDYCGAALGSGERDWVLASAVPSSPGMPASSGASSRHPWPPAEERGACARGGRAGGRARAGGGPRAGG